MNRAMSREEVDKKLHREDKVLCDFSEKAFKIGLKWINNQPITEEESRIDSLDGHLKISNMDIEVIFRTAEELDEEQGAFDICVFIFGYDNAYGIKNEVPYILTVGTYMFNNEIPKDFEEFKKELARKVLNYGYEFAEIREEIESAKEELEKFIK